MRRLLLAVCAAAVSLGAAPAPADDEAQAVIERAVKAHGGFDRLSRVHADRVKSRGVLIVNGRETPFESETTVQLPNQFRNVLQLEGDRKAVFVEVLNGDKIYFTLDGQPQKVDDNLTTEIRETMQLNQAIRLVPLLTDKTYVLEPLGEVKIDDQPCLGVKATAKGRREVRLFFNKESGLLVKTEHSMDDGAGKEAVQEEFYSDFEDVKGYKRPKKMVAYRNGKKIMEAETTDVQYSGQGGRNRVHKAVSKTRHKDTTNTKEDKELNTLLCVFVVNNPDFPPDENPDLHRGPRRRGPHRRGMAGRPPLAAHG